MKNFRLLNAMYIILFFATTALMASSLHRWDFISFFLNWMTASYVFMVWAKFNYVVKI